MRSEAAIRPLPPLMVLAGSGFVLFHFLALLVLAIGAPSGPWPTAFGSSTALPPPFASAISEVTTRNYLRPLHMTHNYHFLSNTPEMPSVVFDVRLKDKFGKLTTLEFPDKNANFWVQHRQRLLASALGDDTAVQIPRGQVVLPKGQKARTQLVWKGTEGNPVLRLERVSDLELAGSDRPLMKPSEWSMLVAQSYVRYLCRLHGAESGQIIRRHRNAIQPSVLFFAPLPPDTFEEQASSFGEIRP